MKRRELRGRAGGLARWAAPVSGALATLAVAGTPAVAQGSDVTPFTLSTLGSHSGGMLPLAQVNSAHGCHGGNSPPDLQWTAVPHGTKSFAVTLFDSTARNGAGFWHWAMFDLPGDLRSLAIGAKPPGAKVGRNDFGDDGYGGACPPPGKAHAYHFVVWALGDATLPMKAGAPDSEIGAYLKAHALGKADLTMTYERSR